MPAAVETMAWTGQEPWHREGVKVAPDLTPDEMMIAAELDWTVSKRPSYTIDTPEYGEDSRLIQAPDTFHIVRDSDNAILSSCGNGYIPTQNKQIFDFLTRFASAADFSMETAGSLRGGKSVWALAKVPHSFALPGDDEVKGYLLFHQPHEAGYALTARYTQVRVVCNNTLQLAFNANQASFRMSHINAFDEDMANQAAKVLGLTSESQVDFQEAATFLAGKKAKHDQVLEYVAEIYQPTVLEESRAQREALGEQAPLVDSFNRYPKLAVEALERAPGALLESSKGTWWGALNAVTYVEDHLREGENAVYNSLMGEGSKRKAKALKLATTYAEAA